MKSKYFQYTMAELELKEKLKKFADEMGMNDDALEIFIYTLEPFIENYINLNIENELSKEEIQALEDEADNRNYDISMRMALLLYAFEEKSQLTVQSLIDEYVEQLITEFYKTKQLLQKILQKVLVLPKEQWEEEFKAYTDILVQKDMKAATSLFVTDEQHG